MHIAVSTSPESVDFAASKGMTIMVGGPTAVMGQVPEVIAMWRERIAALRDLGINSIRCNFGKAGLDQGKMRRCMHMFAKEVMLHYDPSCRARKSRASTAISGHRGRGSRGTSGLKSARAGHRFLASPLTSLESIIMARIGFVGLGNMGGPMARNLMKGGHALKVFDLSEEAMNFAVQSGAEAANSAKAAAGGVDFAITMLPEGAHVREVVMNDGIIAGVDPGTVLIDSSTIDVETAQAAHAAAAEAGFEMLDAPVSGGVVGADAGSLTFMCGGDAATFAKVRPILQAMGHNIVHCGGPGLGQATKICNNMLAGINALASAEAMVMGTRLGVSKEVLYDVISTSSGRSFYFDTSNPMPGTVATAPASNDFKPGFMSKLMLKDLRLSQAAAQASGTATPLGATATAAFQHLVEGGHGDEDSSSIIKLIDPKAG